MKGKNKKEIRLGWEESKPHYQELKRIERDAWLGFDGEESISNTQKKRIEAKIHNETRDYLNSNELVYKNGGFYETKE